VLLDESDWIQNRGLLTDAYLAANKHGPSRSCVKFGYRGVLRSLPRRAPFSPNAEEKTELDYFMVTKNSNKKLHLPTDRSGTFVTFRNGSEPNRKRDRRRFAEVLHS
jgi:hypothetical protein